MTSGTARGIGHFARFGVTSELIRRALAAALSRGGDDADLFFEHSLSHSLGLEDGEVNRAYSGVSLGVGIRVLKGDQTGYGFTEDLSAEALLACARTAAAIADGPARPGPRRLQVRPPKADRYPLARAWEEVLPAEKLPLLTDLNERAFAADPRVVKVSVGFSDATKVVLIADARGRVVEDHQPMTSLNLSCVAEDGGRRESGGYGAAGRAGLDFHSRDRLDRIVREAVARTTVLFEAGPAPVGEMPVVLAAGASGILLHEAIGHGMEADFARKGVSIFSDRIGHPVARDFVSIVDDGTQAGARGAINVDDEGNPAGCTVLVEGGVLRSFLHDGISARHFGVAPTGNGRRQSFRHAPLPRMRSTYMLPGPHHRDEIVASVKRGIYCANFANGQVNIGAGDFTFYVKNGWLIEEGRLTRPIKDVNLIGNGPKVLEAVDMVADDLVIDEGGWTCGKDGQSMPVSQGMPTVRVASLTVGGTGGESMTALLDAAREAVRLARSLGAQEAAADAVRTREVETAWRDGALERIQEATSRALSVYLYVDGRYGAVATSDLRPEALEPFIAEAVAMTRVLGPDPHRALPEPARYEGRAALDLDLDDPGHGRLDADLRRRLPREAEEAARSVPGAERILSVTASFSDARTESVKVHSNGFEGARTRTAFSLGAEVSVRDDDGRRPEDGAWATVRHLADLPGPDALGREAAGRTLGRLGARKGDSAVLTMAVDNRAAGRLVASLLGPLSGSALQQKRSFLEGRLGTPVGGPLLSLSDDPFLPRGLGSHLWDGEGMASRPRPIFEAGVPRTWFLDTYYARKLGLEPTTGGPSNLAWALGDRGGEDLVRDLGEGILVTDFLGGNANGTTGDFSFGVQGYRIRGGRRAGPVGEMNIAGNHLEFWKGLVAVGNDPYPFSSLRTPTLVFEGVQFAGA